MSSANEIKDNQEPFTYKKKFKVEIDLSDLPDHIMGDIVEELREGGFEFMHDLADIIEGKK